jgi:UDP-glucose:(heptosyl)LPS alpha-1,3-glucosyltransferase
VKIAIIRSECSFSKGGAEHYAANLCRMGHEVSVIAEFSDPGIHPDLMHIPVKVNRATSASRTRSFNRNAPAALAGIEVDQVTALSRSFPSGAFRVSDPLHCYWIELRYTGKIRNILERMRPRHRSILRIEKAIMDPANTRLVTTNSLLAKKLIGKYYDYPQDRINVIYNGVDFGQFSPDPDYREGKRLEFLFVGQDFKRKGLDPVIRALSQVLSAGHQCLLSVIGRDDPAPYRQLAAQVGVSLSIRFQGPTHAIQDAYRSCDSFVFPSLYDPFANVVLEALACGLPALTTTTNGSSEIITEGENGYVIEGATDHLVADLAPRMVGFCELPPEQRARMRVAARIAAEAYPIEKNAQKIISTLCP